MDFRKEALAREGQAWAAPAIKSAETETQLTERRLEESKRGDGVVGAKEADSSVKVR